MGLFSAFKQNLYDITNLDREEADSLISFFSNGWAAAACQRGGIPYDPIMTHGIVKGLRKGVLTEDELTVLIAVLEADIRQNGGDDEEREIVLKLKQCRKAGPKR